MKKEKLCITLPPDTAAKLRAEAARRHVPVSALAALAVERYMRDLEFTEAAGRLEVLLRAVLYGVGELLAPGGHPAGGREVARRLVNQAAARMKEGCPGRP